MSACKSAAKILGAGCVSVQRPHPTWDHRVSAEVPHLSACSMGQERAELGWNLLWQRSKHCQVPCLSLGGGLAQGSVLHSVAILREEGVPSSKGSCLRYGLGKSALTCLPGASANWSESSVLECEECPAEWMGPRQQGGKLQSRTPGYGERGWLYPQLSSGYCSRLCWQHELCQGSSLPPHIYTHTVRAPQLGLPCVWPEAPVQLPSPRGPSCQSLASQACSHLAYAWHRDLGPDKMGRVVIKSDREK